MKKTYQIIIILSILILAYWLYFYSGLDQLLIQLIILNIIIYILRTIIIRFSNALVKNRLFRMIFSTVINIFWIAFLFVLLFQLSPIYAISIISFLVIAISLTFRDLISNVASGVMILTTQMIQPGELIETNDISGIVDEITLNYTKIKEFDGVIVFMPNSKLYNSSITRFTHKQFKKIRSLTSNDKTTKKQLVQKYAGQVKQIIEREKKVTSYVKTVELISTVDPKKLDENLAIVFDKYEKILGLRSTYNVDRTTFDRLVISLRINSENPNLVLEYTDAFLRDVLFQINHAEIFDGWDEYNSKNNPVSIE
jgi:small conductance mechanosensitive channel